MSSTALATGITGQGGSYLAESVVAKGHKMQGGAVSRLFGLREAIGQTSAWSLDQTHIRGG